jgi:hypothetical protein
MRRCRACNKPIQGEHACDLADLPKELRALVEAVLESELAHRSRVSPRIHSQA